MIYNKANLCDTVEVKFYGVIFIDAVKFLQVWKNICQIIWLEEREQYLNPYFQGSDPGVSFISGYDIQKELLIVLVSNYGDDVWRLFKDIKEYFKG